jgi:hypothetical protein
MLGLLISIALAVSVGNLGALFIFNARHKKDAAASDAALRTDAQSIESLRKELSEVRLDAARNRTAEYTTALSEALSHTLNEALRNNTLVTRNATQPELRAGKPLR